MQNKTDDHQRRFSLEEKSVLSVKVISPKFNSLGYPAMFPHKLQKLFRVLKLLSKKSKIFRKYLPRITCMVGELDWVDCTHIITMKLG